MALKSMKSSGYELKDALCELIDNSLWHGDAENVNVENLFRVIFVSRGLSISSSFSPRVLEGCRMSRRFSGFFFFAGGSLSISCKCSYVICHVSPTGNTQMT